MSDTINIIVQEPASLIRVVNTEPSSAIRIGYENVIERVIEEPAYPKSISGFTVTVLQAEHGLTFPKGLRVTDQYGEEVEVKETYLGTTVRIDSNIDLADHLLVIY